MNKYTYLHVVQMYTSYGWEDVTESEIYREARSDIKAYRANAPEYSYRLIKRRELNDATVSVKKLLCEKV